MVCLASGRMGNEESYYRKIEIEEETVEVTDNWSLHYAKDLDANTNKLSAFVSQSKASQLDGIPLDKLAKNLMIHRHPFIVKYISSWNQNSRMYLITEEVLPLPLVISSQSSLKICIGLYNVLSALVFLHEKAKASHNNVCCASIYVTPEGVWKLGGLEYLKKFSDVTGSYLRETRAFRYEKAVPPEEDSALPNVVPNAKAVDGFAFGVLVDELLKKKSGDEIALLSEFRDFCKKNLVNSSAGERASLSDVLSHPFFDHDFIRISRFLFDLPIKSNYEKEEFFRDLSEQLHLLPEDVVGSQLASSLLSRVVFLDATAQKRLLPVLLRPRSEKHEGGALFSENLFKKYVIPKLLQIFCVRDVQIRLLLLDHFHLFCDSFTSEQLKHQVLPELLVGIKDVDDQLVSATLKALSRMVTMLGASTVVGGKRGKLFTDGRPKGRSADSGDAQGKAGERTQAGPPESRPESGLPERPSPDGGEAESSATAGAEAEGESESWSDWDVAASKESSKLEPVEKNGDVPPSKMADISSLDIKSGAEEEPSLDREMDFFRDMEPVISKTQVLSVTSRRTKFDVESNEADNWDGWGEDWELGEVA